ncbi:hypothetical protein PPYR_15295 [Photinus pyralis]|uniref:Odorant receptor n=2 Tax=Photinus pyralis TaxID=7054 RepID=A0A5N4A0D4_PHOPY|nr:hypothetical protein PPYR_15295 [Photinus pyralis]
MTATGAWPDHSSITYNIKALFFHAFTIGLFVTMSMQVIFNLNDFTNLSEILYIMVTVTGYVVKQCALTYKRNVFVNLIQFLKDPLFLSYPDELDHYMFETVKKSTLIANVYRFSIAFCIVLFTVYPILENKPLPFPFPYDLGNYRYFMYAFQIISVGVCAWNNCTIDTLTTSLMGIAAAQLDILYEKLIVIRKESQENDDVPYCEKSEEDILHKLRQCVEHHNAIIHLVESIEDIFTVGLLAQFTCSIIVICNTVFYIILMWTINSQFVMLLDYLIILMLQLFMYCWYGNEIILKSVKIGEACYKFNWCDSGTPVRQTLFIIMERSKRPLTITTVKLSTLSLSAYKSILQWSYSCLALLLKMEQQRKN